MIYGTQIDFEVHPRALIPHLFKGLGVDAVRLAVKLHLCTLERFIHAFIYDHQTGLFYCCLTLTAL